MANMIFAQWKNGSSTITGPSADRNHQGWFDVNAVEHGITSPVNAQNAGGGAMSRPTFGDVRIAMANQTGVTDLLLLQANGTRLSLTIEEWGAAAASPKILQKLELTSAYITSFDSSTNVGSSTTDLVLTVAFGKLVLTQTPYNSAGSPQTPKVATFDIINGRYS